MFVSGSNVKWHKLFAVLGIALFPAGAAVASNAPPRDIQRDVVVVGGGASGTYAAVRLREDFGKSVLLIETRSNLGGHTSTYDIPETGLPFNFGVQTYMDYGPTKALFQRFNISVQVYARSPSTTVYVDPDTGKPVPNPPTPPPLSESIAALRKYLAIIGEYDDILLPGYWKFPQGNQIPQDLLLPFRDFVRKYDLQAAGPIISLVSGISADTQQPTLYVVMNFGTPAARGYADTAYIRPEPYNNSMLYDKAARLLGPDVMLASTVEKTISRSDRGVRLLVKNHKTGATTAVHAKRIIVAAQPSLRNLGALALDEQERAIFRTWANSTSFIAVVRTNILPDNISVTFVANTTDGPPPYSFRLIWLGHPGYHRIIFSSRTAMTGREVKAAIESRLQTMARGGAFPPLDGGSQARAEVVAISDHSTVHWAQSVEQLKNGFMQKLYALQGRRGTWFTGGLWCPDYSSNVWAFTDTVLPRLVEDMKRMTEDGLAVDERGVGGGR